MTLHDLGVATEGVDLSSGEASVAIVVSLDGKPIRVYTSRPDADLRRLNLDGVAGAYEQAIRQMSVTTDETVRAIEGLQLEFDRLAVWSRVTTDRRIARRIVRRIGGRFRTSGIGGRRSYVIFYPEEL